MFTGIVEEVGEIVDLNENEDGFKVSVKAQTVLNDLNVNDSISWAHFDIYGWNPAKRVGRPIGGEAMGLRAVYTMLEKRYPN